jgi:hypothetical protein
MLTLTSLPCTVLFIAAGGDGPFPGMGGGSSSRFGGSPAYQDGDDDMIWESGSTSDNPFASAFGGMGGMRQQQQSFSTAGTQQQRKRPGSSSSTSSSWGTPRSPQQQQQEVDLQLSLEELYRGVTKKLKVSRQVFDAATGRVGRQAGQEVLEVQVKPGWKEGERPGNLLSPPAAIGFALQSAVESNFVLAARERLLGVHADCTATSGLYYLRCAQSPLLVQVGCCFSKCICLQARESLFKSWWCMLIAVQTSGLVSPLHCAQNNLLLACCMSRAPACKEVCQPCMDCCQVSPNRVFSHAMQSD